MPVSGRIQSRDHLFEYCLGWKEEKRVLETGKGGRDEREERTGKFC